MVSMDNIKGGKHMVTMMTSLGAINLELDVNQAPITVKNFLTYVESGFYDGTLFHRVIPGFMIQGGGMSPGLIEKKTAKTINNEADNGLKNERGTIAMARTQDPHSASAQFFINLKDNHFLDHTEKSVAGWGYAVFGRVILGMDVVDQIALVETSQSGRHGDVPVNDVLVERVEVGQ